MGKKHRLPQDEKNSPPEKKPASTENKEDVQCSNKPSEEEEACAAVAATTSSSSRPSDALLWLARKKRSIATSHHDLEEVYDLLQQILVDAQEGSDEWINAGTFLATCLLQEKTKHDEEEEENHRNTVVSSLLDERGFSYHLSRQALTQRHDTTTTPHPPPPRLASAWDNVLSPLLLQKLTTAFCAASTFWSTHNYSDGCSSGKPPSPYFSYIVPLNGDSSSTTTSVLVDIIHTIQRQISTSFPDVMDCTAAEFWSHCRPHGSGHQLHFDSDDEGRGGVVRNPVVSTVLYLSEKEVGGETLITTQSASSQKLATKGWLCRSKKNRLLAFQGNLLHGVMPGAGAEDAHRHGRRITFMVAFWKQITIQEDDGPGAARPFFSRVVNETQPWAQTLIEEPTLQQTGTTTTITQDSDYYKSCCNAAEDCFFEVPLWQDVDENKNKKFGCSIQDLKKKHRMLPPYDAFFQFFT